MKLAQVALGTLTIVLLVSCGPGDDDATQSSDPFAAPAVAAPRSTPTKRPLTRSKTPFVPIPSRQIRPTLITGTIVPAPQAQIDLAIADLMQRRGVAHTAIAVLEARSVVWPNAGLGCPRPGVTYKQVPVDGVFIRLAISDEAFHYHGGNGKKPFLCTTVNTVKR